MNTSAAAFRASRRSRTVFLIVVRASSNGIEIVFVSRIVNTDGPLTGLIADLIFGKKAAPPTGMPHPYKDLPLFPDPSKFQFFDWAVVEFPGNTDILSFPAPGVIFAFYGNSVPGIELVQAAYAKNLIGKTPGIQEFFAAPESKFEPIRIAHTDVFISYSSSDSTLAKELKDSLEALGKSVFMAEVSINLGERWEPSILESLRNCAVLIVLATVHSLGAPWLIFEAGAAWALGIPIACALDHVTQSQLPAALSSYQASKYETMAERDDFVSKVIALIDAT